MSLRPRYLFFSVAFFLAISNGWTLGHANMVGSAHDFTRGKGGKGELCAYCHLMDSRGEVSSPLLWNPRIRDRSTALFSSRETYFETSLSAGMRTIGSSSQICMSCHDGITAKGVSIEAAEDMAERLRGLSTIGRKGNPSGSHPVGVPYPDYRGATYNSVITSADPNGYNPFPQRVKLYGSGRGARGIECSSCHDIHQGTANKALLRDSVRDLCLRCHLK